ncbi:hypothetical protein GQ602_002082 [Ophiocordyceps camponoti-floridani]|uniref:Uncharacterized protein n=1 Tax=Ophiocordyceps camponoti-floridani TaxID=2030778 RepID=A0A8H4Q9N7_9HYPO|nr:hypothetical protein GQ602_002082 [Ophiocordyceps camponoti-floridani]
MPIFSSYERVASPCFSFNARNGAYIATIALPKHMSTRSLQQCLLCPFKQFGVQLAVFKVAIFKLPGIFNFFAIVKLHFLIGSFEPVPGLLNVSSIGEIVPLGRFWALDTKHRARCRRRSAGDSACSRIKVKPQAPFRELDRFYLAHIFAHVPIENTNDSRRSRQDDEEGGDAFGGGNVRRTAVLPTRLWVEPVGDLPPHPTRYERATAPSFTRVRDPRRLRVEVRPRTLDIRPPCLRPEPRRLPTRPMEP